MSKEYRISTNNIVVEDTAWKDIQGVIPLSQKRAFFLYFERNTLNRCYMTVDLQTGKVLNQGAFCATATSEKYLDDNTIVYFDQSDMKLKAFLIEEGKDIPEFQVSLPTLSILPTASRHKESIQEALADQKIYCFPQSKTVVIVECKQAAQLNTISYVLTAYTMLPEIHSIEITATIAGIDLVHNPINLRDALVMYRVQISESPHHPGVIHIWNFFPERHTLPSINREAINSSESHHLHPRLNQLALLQTVNFQTQLDGVIISVTGWKESAEIAFWINGKASKGVFVFVYNQVTRSEKEITLTMFGPYRLLLGVFEVDFPNERVILNSVSEKSNAQIDIINPIKNSIVYTEEISSSDEISMFSPDFRYFLTYSHTSEYDFPNSSTQSLSTETSQTLVSTYQVIGNKASIMHLLLESKICQKYGEEASKAIIDMLTLKEEVE